MTFSSSSFWRLTAVAILSFALLGLLLRGCLRSSSTSSRASESFRAASSTGTISTPLLTAHDGAALAAKVPLGSLPGSLATGMISLTLRFDQGRLIESAREVTPQAAVRPLRRIEGQAGIYHRIVGPGGEVLFENLVPDPRKVPWDTTDDGKKLSGGVATLSDIPLQLRLPAGLHGRLQVFEKKPGWMRSTLDKDGGLMGDFKL